MFNIALQASGGLVQSPNQPLQSSLQDMRDIHQPEPVSTWPPAPGWWLLTLVLLTLLFYLYVKAASYNRKRAYRREAAEELMRARERFRSTGDDSQYAQDILELLKRTALMAYPNDKRRIAGLHGDAWLKFLDSTCPNCKFNSAEGRALLESAYGDKPNRSALQQCYVQAKLWIAGHRTHGGLLSA